MVIHFKSQKDRLDFLKGNYEEIILPTVVEKTEKVEEKPKKGKKSAKKSKKEDKNGEDKAE